MGGLSTPVLEAGPEGASEAVVFVHGNPGSSGDWAALVDAVGEFARAVAFDNPGFGKADKPKDFDYNVGSYATFIQGAPARDTQCSCHPASRVECYPQPDFRR